MSKVSTMSIVFVLSSVLFWAFSARAAEQVSGKTFYTTANIWYERRSQIESTNYHRGSILPTGTKVKIAEVCDGATTSYNSTLDARIWEPFIRFDDESGQSYKLVFRPRHSREGMTVWDLFGQYFSENNPMVEGGAFKSLTAEEQKSVMAGEIAVGMSKTAVVMAYGYPPGHKTPSLKLDKWIYWESRVKTKTVCFSDDKVKAESGAGRESQETKTVSPIDECIKACKENTHRTPEQCFDACKRQ